MGKRIITGGKGSPDRGSGIEPRAPRTFTITDISDLLLIEAGGSFIIAGKAGTSFPLCIETSDQEYVQRIDPTDLVVVSAPEGGPIEPAMMFLELVRQYNLPLIVLTPGHPGSRRLRYVISAGPQIHLSCSIQRGTHPEQHLLCSSAELSEVVLRGTDTGVELDRLPDSAVVRIMKSRHFLC